jgi:hypothetical protein
VTLAEFRIPLVTSSLPQRPAVVLGPVDQILYVVDDATSMLAIFGTDTQPTHVIEGAGAQAKERCGFTYFIVRRGFELSHERSLVAGAFERYSMCSVNMCSGGFDPYRETP